MITAPTAAAVMQQTAVHWAEESISPKTANPASPAATGSRFCSTPTTRGGSLRRAANSSEYGPAAESTATASPTSSTSGRASRVPLSATPVRHPQQGRPGHREGERRAVDREPPGPPAQQEIGPHRHGARQGEDDARRGQGSPGSRIAREGRGGEQQQPRSRQQPPQQVAQAPRRQQDDRQRPEQLDRHRHSERQVPQGEVDHVHPRDGRAEGHHQQPLAAVGRQPGPPQGAQQHGGEPQPQRHHAHGTGRAEQVLAQRLADLDADDAAQHQRRCGHPAGERPRPWFRPGFHTAQGPAAGPFGSIADFRTAPCGIAA
ncbi:hypothetical protein LUW77_26540 [Streptomyces radiopugnans]|nr:hypothetical protein LUW77_26540 [Streptomyces radiopugnans]